MKSLLAFVLIFAALIAVALSSDCVKDGRTFKEGEKYHPPGQCQEITCTGNNSWSGKGCAEMHALKPCVYVPMDKTKPYPACCPRFNC